MKALKAFMGIAKVAAPFVAKSHPIAGIALSLAQGLATIKTELLVQEYRRIGLALIQLGTAMMTAAEDDEITPEENAEIVSAIQELATE